MQELQQLLDEANQSLEESGTPSHEIVVVVLHRGDVASSLTAGLGIALAGGADYETKEITVISRRAPASSGSVCCCVAAASNRRETAGRAERKGAT